MRRSFPDRDKSTLLESQDGGRWNPLSDEEAGEIDDSSGLINDGGITGRNDSWEADENVFGNPDGLRITWDIHFLQVSLYFLSQSSAPTDGCVEEEHRPAGLPFFQEGVDEPKGLFGPSCPSEIA